MFCGTEIWFKLANLGTLKYYMEMMETVKLELIFIMKLLICLLLFLLQMGCKTQPIKCSIQDPIPIDHKYFQPGDLIIGGITSFLLITRDVGRFEDDPHHSVVGESL